MDLRGEFPWQSEQIVRHSQMLLSSFHHWTDKSLIQSAGSEVATAQALFEADFVLVSHGVEADPILNYGNQAALSLWQMNWAELTSTPSRLTAEPMARAERDRLLTQAKQQGYISNYRGIRISSTGKRFYIENATIWNVVDEQNKNYGQAATFGYWSWIE